MRPTVFPGGNRIAVIANGWASHRSPPPPPAWAYSPQPEQRHDQGPQDRLYPSRRICGEPRQRGRHGLAQALPEDVQMVLSGPMIDGALVVAWRRARHHDRPDAQASRGDYFAYFYLVHFRIAKVNPILLLSTCSTYHGMKSCFKILCFSRRSA